MSADTCNEEDRSQSEDLEDATTEGQWGPWIFMILSTIIIKYNNHFHSMELIVTHFECQYLMSTTRSSCQFMSMVERLAPRIFIVSPTKPLLVSSDARRREECTNKAVDASTASNQLFPSRIKDIVSQRA